jgi:hypothetical protein
MLPVVSFLPPFPGVVTAVAAAVPVAVAVAVAVVVAGDPLLSLEVLLALLRL